MFHLCLSTDLHTLSAIVFCSNVAESSLLCDLFTAGLWTPWHFIGFQISIGELMGFLACVGLASWF